MLQYRTRPNRKRLFLRTRLITEKQLFLLFFFFVLNKLPFAQTVNVFHFFFVSFKHIQCFSSFACKMDGATSSEGFLVLRAFTST